MARKRALKRILDALYRDYHRDYLETDPLLFPRRYRRRDDREVVGFIAASLAYGRVDVMRRAIASVLERLGDRPPRALLRPCARARPVDPADPVRYDFALCRLGVLGECPPRPDPAACAPCGLRGLCRYPFGAAGRAAPGGCHRSGRVVR